MWLGPSLPGFLVCTTLSSSRLTNQRSFQLEHLASSFKLGVTQHQTPRGHFSHTKRLSSHCICVSCFFAQSRRLLNLVLSRPLAEALPHRHHGPAIPRASIELDYPLYAVDFDPEDSTRLVVGGGGGAGRSGVGNKITVLETLSQQELRIAGEIDLSRDEDSVMSLAVGPHKGKTTYLYAGVNSSHDSIAKGKNEHLRTLAIEQSKALRRGRD
ncbi:hypothetical protein NW754_006032 [Fusarium falciforme]|nr:hypothetical protein NW754_006032 [Fusarium falciforme]